MIQKNIFSRLIINLINTKFKLIVKYLNYIVVFILFSQVLHADEILNLGKNIFLEKGNCATCHSLSDAGSNADIGPNLDIIKPDIGRVVIAVTNGIGVMPAYEGMLTPKEIEAVAIYVSKKSN